MQRLNVCTAVHTEPVNLGSSSKTLTTHKQHAYLRITREMWKHASITLSTRQINANSYIGKFLSKRNLSPLYQYLSLRFNKALKGLFISSKCLHNWPIFSPWIECTPLHTAITLLHTSQSGRCSMLNFSLTHSWSVHYNRCQCKVEVLFCFRNKQQWK